MRSTDCHASLHNNANQLFFLKYLIRHQSLKLTHSFKHSICFNKLDIMSSHFMKSFYRKVFRFKSLSNSPVSGGVCQTWL